MNGGLSDLSAIELQALLQRRESTSLEVVRTCVARIEALDFRGPELRAVIELNSEAESIATALDRERADGMVRGPLHGIPVLLKDNIETADTMETTAGSLALLGSRPREDATVAARLRAAGAVLLGKANMSEWANFRSTKSSSGWSARGGQARNPYRLDRSPCGSSSGSATAVAARYVPLSLGTETSGSILCPGSFNAVVGIKPTVGLTSRAGVIPIAHSQDTVGPFARSVADAALLLDAIAGRDPRDPATMTSPAHGGTVSSPPAGADLQGVRIGVPRRHLFGYHEVADQLADKAIGLLRDLGAEIVDPADIPSVDEIRERAPMMTILLYEFKADLAEYLATRPDAPVRSLADVIRFNEEHAADEMPFFGQEIFLMAEEKGPLTDSEYIETLSTAQRLAREQGIDAVMEAHRLDALLAPTSGPPFPIDHENGDDHGGGGSAGIPALAGYPAITIPAGDVEEGPIGVTLFGRAFSDPILIRIAQALESALPPVPPPSR